MKTLILSSLIVCLAPSVAGARCAPGEERIDAENDYPAAIAQALAQDVWRVALNEAGTETDLRMIIQAVSRFRTLRAGLLWLRCHSGRATGWEAPRRRGNDAWTRNMTPGNPSPPEGWRWDRRLWDSRQARYRRLYQIARRAIFRRARVRQCNGIVLTWGSRRILADRINFDRRNDLRRARGQRPLDVLECGATSNFGAGYATR